MQLDPHTAGSTTAVREDPPAPSTARARPPPLALNGAEARPAPPLLGAVVPPARKGPPRLTLGVSTTMPAPLDRPSPTAGPALTVQPASPAMSTSSTPSTSPFPPPVPSTSSLDTAQQAAARAPSFQPPPSSVANGGGLAARRAAKLGKKRLSLVVPANPHSSLPSAGPDGPSTTLLSPVTPSFLRPSTGASIDAETRSLPPSPLLLTTFIGAEGTEAPDRTIGRLMLKQQADEMREQMRGGRGMKRRTSIPRLNLVRGGASAHPASLDPTAPPVERVATPAAGGGGAPSAVQLIRGDAVERGLAADGDVVVEEFPYANGPREIIPGVFLGSEQNAKDAQVLRDWRIGFVLNVAKEVECPWSADDDEEDAHVGSQVSTPGQDGPPLSEPARGASLGQPRSAKAQPSPASTFASSSSPYGATAASQPPVRPPFVRPTASTPNLHAVFHPPTPPPPAVPAIPISFLPSPPDSDPMLRSLSTSPPQQSRRLSRQSLRRSGGSTTSATTTTAPSAATTSSCPGSVRYAAQARTGRPSLEYLWLKWGHDEADLVEAHKFQAAFAFLDEARDQGERVLVHCQCGVSRSATVVIAYCMREAARALAEGRDSDELAGCTGMHDTYSFVKEKSEWVGPNLSLVFQLVAYERTLRGDSASGEEGDEPPYPHYPPEPTSARPPDGDDDLPPPTPAVGFSPFAFPPPPPAPRSTSYGMPSINGHGNAALPSPRTPSSPHPVSQLSTPDLAHHDPLVSPSLSTATKASSVTSTPGSTVGRQGLSPQAVRIVRAVDEGEDELAASADRAKHSSGETLGAPETSKGVQFGAFAVPPPPPSHYTASLEDAASPTAALYPPGVPRHETLSGHAQGNGRSHFAPPLRTSSLRAALPPLQVHLPSPPSSAPRHSSPITMVVNSPSSPAPPRQLPPLQLSRPRPTSATVTSPLSPGSNASITSPTAILSALSLSSSSGSSASLAAPLSALSRTNSTSSQTGRRFGVSQTALERRASHRRVCSDTIRVPVAGFTAAVASPGGSRPASPAQLGGSSTRSARAEEQQG